LSHNAVLRPELSEFAAAIEEREFASYLYVHLMDSIFILST